MFLWEECVASSKGPFQPPAKLATDSPSFTLRRRDAGGIGPRGGDMVTPRPSYGPDLTVFALGFTKARHYGNATINNKTTSD